MRIKDFISENPDFQSSINIGYDFGSLGRIKGLIPTDTVCRYLQAIVSPVLDQQHRRARILVGPYGTGKSHITLTALSSMWIKDPALYQDVIDAYSRNGQEFSKHFEHFVRDGVKLLPVIVSGSSSDLRRSLLAAMRTALSDANLEELMPRTNFTGVIEVLERWSQQYPSTLRRFEELTGCNYQNFVERLTNLETSAYEEFVAVYPELTSGSQYDALADSDVIDLYQTVLAKLDKQGISGIFVVYDEFSKYLETSISDSTIEDVKLLQDFAELCNRSKSTQQLHLLLISHKSLENYIDSRLPKEKVDGWRGVSGRFQEIVVENNPDQRYELIAHAIKKDEKLWSEWLEIDDCKQERILENIEGKYTQTGLMPSEFADTITFGCYPLHPVSTYLLPRISNRVAQNERTLFTYLCSPESNSLIKQLDDCEGMITPDRIYDYFAPLMRKEPYASEMHRVYELANIALSGISEVSLEAKIIKMVALASAVGSYDFAAPTKSLIVETFEEAGYSSREVDEALASLIGSMSLVYLRQSNSFLKLKETSGVRIDAEIENRIERLRDQMTPIDILNELNPTKAHYPSRHNETSSTVRYFESFFDEPGDLSSRVGEMPYWQDHPDGEIIAIVAENADSLKRAREEAVQFTEENPLSIVVVPKKHKSIEEALYRLAAAKQLKEEAGEDRVLAEEYEIVVEDYSEIVNAYIDAVFSPERKESRYYACGKEQRTVTRRRRLSDLMSDLCDSAFPNTPIITSEALNRNRLTGTALHSRARVLKGLCGQHIEPNLGFVGNGQETSMMRSALERTGIIPDCAKPSIDMSPSDPKIRRVLEAIEAFLQSANGAPFSDLYNSLQSPELGIGMKRGPVPLYLAIVLSQYRDQFQITHKGDERPFSAETLEDIDARPNEYSLTLLNWSDEMQEYTQALNTIFGLRSDAQRSQLVDTMKQWFVGLPQFTRNSKESKATFDVDPLSWNNHLRFMHLMKPEVTDTRAFLFDKIPNAFERDSVSADLVEAISREKRLSDRYIDCVVERIRQMLISKLIGDAPSETSLDSAIQDWLEALSPAAREHAYSGLTNQVFNALRNSTPDDRQTISRIAKAATSLRIQDWNDARFEEFLRTIDSAIDEVGCKNLEKANSEPNAQTVQLSFLNEGGQRENISFLQSECSRRASLLKRSLLSNIEDMGQSVSAEEKRQVVFEVLKELC